MVKTEVLDTVGKGEKPFGKQHALVSSGVTKRKIVPGPIPWVPTPPNANAHPFPQRADPYPTEMLAEGVAKEESEVQQ